MSLDSRDLYRSLRKNIEDLRQEIISSVEFLSDLPRRVEEEFINSLSVALSVPLVAATQSLRNVRIASDQIIKAPRYFLEDLRDIPNLTTKFILRSPAEIREELRKYLSWKKKERPLNVIDLIVDILDTIIPG